MAKKIGIVLLGLVLATSAVGFYFWSQLTRLPSWYTEAANRPPVPKATVNLSDPVTIQSTRETIVRRIESDLAQQRIAHQQAGIPNQPVEVQLTPEDVNQLLVSTIAADPGGREVLASAKGVNTTIAPEQIESGLVVNLSQIPTDRLNPSQRSALERTLQLFPGLRDREVYIGFEGTPKVANGQLQFDPNSKIKMGNVSLTIAQLAEQLNIPTEQLQQKLTMELQQLQIQTVQLAQDGIKVRGIANE